MSPDVVGWIAVAAAITAAVAALLAVRAAQRWSARVAAGHDAVRRADALPPLLRLLLAGSVPIADLIGPRLPLHLREAVQRRLRRAGLDEDVSPQQWLAMLMLSACGAAGCAVVISDGILGALLAGSVGLIMPGAWLRDRVARRRNQVMRDLPVYLEMVTLALEAGGSLGVALRLATERAPESPLRRAFLRVEGDLRAGRSRAESLAALADRLDVPAVRPLVSALVQAGSSGGSLATVLRAQADQRIEERFARAEKLALEAPVKMLAPLVLCIFPCTFVILAFPLLMRFLSGD